MFRRRTGFYVCRGALDDPVQAWPGHNSPADSASSGAHLAAASLAKLTGSGGAGTSQAGPSSQMCTPVDFLPVPESKWREMGFQSEMDARAILGNDAFDGSVLGLEFLLGPNLPIRC
jgi:hypothetical protein